MFNNQEELLSKIKKNIVFFKWTDGYFGKAKIMNLMYSKTLKMDSFLARYDDGGYVFEHTDKLGFGTKLYRLNFIIWKTCKSGGKFHGEHVLFNLFDRVICFRADKPHSCSTVVGGRRYLFSIGKYL